MTILFACWTMKINNGMFGRQYESKWYSCGNEIGACSSKQLGAFVAILNAYVNSYSLILS